MIALLAITFFIFVEYIFSSQLGAFLGRYYTYVFELIFFFATLLYFREFKLSIRFRPVFLLSLILGAAAAFLIKPLGIVFPFNLKDSETIFFLLVVAPVLEELIFRYALWEYVERTSTVVIAWVATSLLFSFSHFYAYFGVPESLKSFVIYQTAYTFSIALYFGYYRLKDRGLFVPIFLHFLFNFGFFLVGVAAS